MDLNRRFSMVEVFCVIAVSDKPLPATTVKDIILKDENAPDLSLPSVIRRLDELKQMGILKSRQVKKYIRACESFEVNDKNKERVVKWIDEQEKELKKHVYVRKNLTKIRKIFA